MHTEDSSIPNPDWLTDAICNAIDVPDDVVDAAWKRFAAEHVVPGRLIQLAFGLMEASETELIHIYSCDTCRSQFDYYRSTTDQVTNSHAHVNGKSGQRDLWAKDQCESIIDNRAIVASHHDRGKVPASLREHFLIDGSVIMPGEEVANTTWQFGLLMKILKESPGTGAQILTEICDAVFSALQTRSLVTAQPLAVVCFGRAMHRCGIELATRFHDAGYRTPHVILAHDYYDPCLVCNRNELANIDVVVLIDVLHSGSLLRRLIAACNTFSPRRVTGLALVDQSQIPLQDIEYYGIWSAEVEARVPLTHFVNTVPTDTKGTLRRFEPNAECACQIAESIEVSKPNHLLPDIDPQLLVHVLATDALKSDHPISGKTYPFVVNVLDLIRRDDEARRFIVSCSKSVLADLAFQKTCLAFHVGRSQRAGRIAKVLSDSTGWPSISIGTKGATFTLTDKQCRQLACYDNVVLVDAAIRTGETLSAISRAVLRDAFFNRPRFIAFAVLNALTSMSQTQLSEELGIEVRTLFDFPLTPPTEEVRHWAKAQKVAIGAAVVNDPSFESLRSILRDYCEVHHHRIRPTRVPQSRTDKLQMARRAIAYGRPSLFNVKEIAIACQMKSPRAIRHLPIAEVIHDSAMQSVLMGVMYNSVPAALKESAVFGLAAANNYDWMNLQWLKCNRQFLNTTQAWKSVLLVECQMKLKGNKPQLSDFRDAATEYRDALRRDDVVPITCDTFQQSLFPDSTSHGECRVELSSRTGELQRVVQRLDTFIQIAE